MIRSLSGIAGVVLTGYIIWAFGAAPFWESGAAIVANPWGMVTLVDLYVGFLLMAFIIFMVEKEMLQKAIWIIPLFFLGNVWSALWIVVRWKTIRSRLGG